MPVCDFYTDYDFIMSLIFVDVLFHIFTSGSPRLPFSYLAQDVFCLHTTCQIAKKGRHTKLTTDPRTTPTSKLWLQVNTEEEKWANKCEAALCTRKTTTTHGRFFFFMLGSHLAMSRKLLLLHFWVVCRVL